MNTLAAALLLTIMVSIETPERIQAGWEAIGHTEQVQAWAEWEVGTLLNCVIHVPPLSPATMQLWLHEIEHCRSGLWH